MENVGAKVREFPRFVVGNRVQALGPLHAARIGAEYAIDVGPDGDISRLRERTENCGGVIGTVTFERRRHALRRPRDETSHHDHGALLHMLVVPLIQVRVGQAVVDVHAAVLGVCDDENVSRVDPDRLAPLAANRRRAQARRPELAVSDDEIPERIGRATGDVNSLKHRS